MATLIVTVITACSLLTVLSAYPVINKGVYSNTKVPVEYANVPFGACRNLLRRQCNTVNSIYSLRINCNIVTLEVCDDLEEGMN